MAKKSKAVKAKKNTKKIAKKIAKKPSLQQRIAKAKKDMERTKDSALRTGEKLFKEAVREIFKKFKNLERFSWVEYTPHWNDGDPCTFGTSFESLTINDELENEDGAEDLWTLGREYELLSNKKKEEARILKELKTKKEKWEIDSLNRDLETIRTKDLAPVAEKYLAKKTIVDLLENIDDSVYEYMFGEGRVVVTRDEITVEEYQHD